MDRNNALKILNEDFKLKSEMVCSLENAKSALEEQINDKDRELNLIREELESTRDKMINLESQRMTLQRDVDDKNVLIADKSDSNSVTDISIVQGDLESKCNIIRSMEVVHKTLQDLIIDKDEVIDSQKVVIENFLKNSDPDTEKYLKEAKNVIAWKEAEIVNCQKEIKRMEDIYQRNEDSNELMRQLKNEKEVKKNLIKQLDDQLLITQKTELAFKTQEQLIRAKSEIIDNLKTIISQHKNNSSPCGFCGNEDNLMSKTSVSDNGVQDFTNEHKEDDILPVPGLHESLERLSSNALHGLIVNGFLLWADIKRRTTADKIWKAEALKHFSKEEITNAKSMLWDACDENVIGRMIRRQGPSKNNSEVDDISAALTLLAEGEVLPLFVGTSSMVMQTPSISPCSNAADIQSIEEVVERVTMKQTDLLSKNHDRAISKADHGNKKIDDIVKRLDSIEWNSNGMTHTANYAEQSNEMTLAESNCNGLEQTPNPHAEFSAPTIPTNVTDTTTENEWNNVVNRKSRTSWRQKANILRGTGKSDSESKMLSADVHLVVYGLAKQVTSLELSRFLESKGLKLLNCDLLTKYEGARSLSFKITIRSSDYEKATNAELWPIGVGVRAFKFFNNRQENNGRSSNSKVINGELKSIIKNTKVSDQSTVSQMQTIAQHQDNPRMQYNFHPYVDASTMKGSWQHQHRIVPLSSVQPRESYV